MAPDCGHCLRPEFTRSLLKTLLEGGSVNLTGPSGSGRGRLIEDLRRSAPADRPVLHADMKTWKASYEGFIGNLSQQLGTGAGKKPRDLGAIVERVQKNRQGAILLLHHFDALLNNPDVNPGFGVRFFDQLNSLRNQRIALLCVTEQPHDQAVVFVDRKSYGGSWLDLQPDRLPELRWEEIGAEIRRHVAETTDAEVTALIEAVRKEKAPYALLVFLLRNIPHEGELEKSFRRRVARLRRRFKAEGKSQHLGGWFRRLHRCSAALRAAAIVIGVSRLKLPFAALLKHLLPKGSNGPAKPRNP